MILRRAAILATIIGQAILLNPVFADSTGTPLLQAMDGIQAAGSFDTIYSYNFNSPVDHTSSGRVFDHEENSITLNAVKLSLQKPVSRQAPIGFRADLYTGTDAKLIHSAGLGDANDSFDLEQGFLEFNVPTSKALRGAHDLDLKLGKFVTLAGAEVIESKDNWNTSRSFLFGYALPFTHTGVRATYTLDNTWDLAAGINNGWDVTDDNNDGKTLEAHIGFNNIALGGGSSLTVALQEYYGPEAESDNGSHRALSDVVVTYKTPWKPLTLVYNYDYASQKGLASDGSAAEWQGHAGYLRIDLSDDWSIAGRGEYFEDEDGVRLAALPAYYREFTATLEYRPWKGVITRLEYRSDHASKEVFNDDDSAFSKNQDTVSGEVIVSF